MQPSPTHRASFSIGNEADARRVVDVLTEVFFEGDAAVAAFERPDGQWDVTLHFARRRIRPCCANSLRPLQEMASPTGSYSTRSRPRTGSRRAWKTWSLCP